MPTNDSFVVLPESMTVRTCLMDGYLYSATFLSEDAMDEDRRRALNDMSEVLDDMLVHKLPPQIFDVDVERKEHVSCDESHFKGIRLRISERFAVYAKAFNDLDLEDKILATCLQQAVAAAGPAIKMLQHMRTSYECRIEELRDRMLEAGLDPDEEDNDETQDDCER